MCHPDAALPRCNYRPAEPAHGVSGINQGLLMTAVDGRGATGSPLRVLKICVILLG